MEFAKEIDSGSFQVTCLDPAETFELGERLGELLTGGDVVLLHGGLGAGKTLFSKAILSALGFDVDEVTSPSFSLVNLYKTPKHNVYHIDLWRIESGQNAAVAVGLDELADDPNAIILIEWPERLDGYRFDRDPYQIHIDGDGDEARQVKILKKKLTS